MIHEHEDERHINTEHAHKWQCISLNTGIS